jgi:KaiC/GvpD/RAD55 family RecA-like ATPase
VAKRLCTRISQAHWCDPATTNFTLATISSVMRGNPDYGTCWVDELFEGGIVLPEVGEGGQRALTMVLSGPPGTGKTTFAMELCCRLAEDPKPKEQRPDEVKRPLRSLYVTSESHKDWMIQNARSFRWPSVDRIGGTADSLVRIVDLADIQHEADQLLSTEALEDAHPEAGHSLSTKAAAAESAKESFWDVLAKLLGGRRDSIPPPAPRPRPQRTGVLPLPNASALTHLVVIDSLNTIEVPKLEAYRHFMQLTTKGPMLIIAIADAAQDQGTAQDWEFAADIVVRLDRHSFSGYLLRTIEVVKARFQSHVWGQHQLKIYEPNGLPDVDVSSDGPDNNRLRTRRLRAHPYRKEGGIFTFPSIHYVLSRYKTLSPSETAGDLPSPVPYLEELLGNGFPKGRCIALIGGRGTHKSHLGYIQVLDGIVREYRAGKGDLGSERAVVVSLRDGEDMTRDTMKSILVECFHEPPALLAEFEKKGRLEITYFPPGFITPEEFFHRMLLSIHRMKLGVENPHVTVLFNSLDQLSSRFPLCAKQSIFVPGIIQMLCAEQITSYFVAAHDKNARADYYGLDSMAELIVQLNRRVFDRAEYLEYVKRAFPPQLPTAEYEKLIATWPEKLGAVELKIERFAGGQPAGAAGILELVKEGPLRGIYPNEGLILVPYAQDHVDKRMAKLRASAQAAS